MDNTFIAEIRPFGFNLAPLDWAFCAGQTISISQNNTLFAIIGTTYGGDGQSTFLLPNLQDRTTLGVGQGLGLRDWPIGATFGEANHTLLITEVPQHTHLATMAVAPESSLSPTPGTTSYPSGVNRIDNYATTANAVLNGAAIGTFGNSLPHNNVQPVQTLNFCISLYGIYPARS